MEAKSVWLSKIFWVNTIATIAMLVQYYTGYVIDPATQVLILATVNTILRFVTKQPVSWTSGNESGRARLPFLAFLALLLTACLYAGCATTETPQSIAAKSLLSSRQGVIAAATTVDALCSQGIIGKADCDKAAKTYTQAQAAYNTASDAFLLYIQLSDSASLKRFEEAQTKLLALFLDIDTLSKTFGGTK
ncbi:hypothetical protein EG829_00525 [bacterium]|nr:hypothetical protein [bacterium]